jgi:hypothetical protein
VLDQGLEEIAASPDMQVGPLLGVSSNWSASIQAGGNSAGAKRARCQAR